MLAAQRQRPGRGGERDEGRGHRVRAADGTAESVLWPRPRSSCSRTPTRRTGGPPVGRDYEIKPKSVVRDMYERAMTFTEYVSFYGLSRSRDGAALSGRRVRRCGRRARGRPHRGSGRLIDWSGELVRKVDSSLLDEWERLSNPAADPAERCGWTTSRPRSPATCGRSGCWCATRCSAGRAGRAGRWDELGELDGEAGWTADAWRACDRGISPSTTSWPGRRRARPALLHIDVGPAA